MRPIVLLTDFGTGSPYVGEMKGVLASLAPRAPVLDLSHDVRPQDVAEGAFLLGVAWRRFPRGSVFVAVVDPGVGGERAILALETRQGTFLAPDNGLLTWVWEESVSRETGDRAVSRETIRLFSVTNRRLFLPRVSATFHGRDIFAPVAARLSAGLSAAFVGPRHAQPRLLDLPRPVRREDGSLRCHVLYVDHFGNLVTSAQAQDLPAGRLRVRVAGHTIDGLSPSYAAGAGLLALVDSWDHLEIARRDGSAAATLGIGSGAEVEIQPLA